jgi:ADP-heptose:LPS heptosyltransferase
VRRLLRLVEFLGIPGRGEHLDFPLREEDRRALGSLDGASDLRPGTYACVHPGASVADRRWPAERFAAVAGALADRGLRVVLTGTAEEAGLTRAVSGALRAPHVDLAGRTDLGALAALLAGARLLVCNDTGVSHLAAALGVPSVVLFTGSDPDRWAPLDRRRHRAVGRGPGVDPRDVIRQAEDLLGEEPSMPPDPWPAVRRLLAIRLDNIGDVVMLGPALRALRRALPAAEITLLTSPVGAKAAPLLPWIDAVMTCRAVWQDVSGSMPLDPRGSGIWSRRSAPAGSTRP